MYCGKVIGIARGRDSTVLHIEQPQGPRVDVRVKEIRRKSDRPVQIGMGDWLWWEGGDAFWTPRRALGASGDRGYDFDIPLPRVG